MALYRNIAGAEQLGLLLQAVEPMEISDYAGGGGGTVFYDPGIYQLHPLTIDPVTLAPVPTNTITPSQPLPADDTVTPVTTTETAALPDAPVTPAPLPVPVQQIDWLPIITIAGLLVTIFKGEDLFKDKRKFVFVGGLGALYYAYTRKK